MSRCKNYGAGEEHQSTIYETEQECRGIGFKCNKCDEQFCCGVN